MLSGNEVMTKKFETTAEEIVEAGAGALAKSVCKNPRLMLIEDELSSVIAATAARWAINMQKKED